MTKKIATTVLILLSISVFCSRSETPPGEASKTHDWLIVPGQRVGPIQADWHFKDFTAHFGKENVRKIQIHVGEGFYEKAIAVYPGTPEALSVFLTEDGDTIDYIVIEGNQTKWKTADAVTLGDPIERIQAINGKPFLLTGFAWDYPGRVTSWEGGKLPEELKLGFENTREIPWDTFTQVMGDGEFPSDHAVFGQMGLVVNRISVRLD